MTRTWHYNNALQLAACFSGMINALNLPAVSSHHKCLSAGCTPGPSSVSGCGRARRQVAPFAASGHGSLDSTEQGRTLRPRPTLRAPHPEGTASRVAPLPSGAGAFDSNWTHVQINNELAKTQSLEDLFRIVRAGHDRFNKVNAVTALHRIARVRLPAVFGFACTDVRKRLFMAATHGMCLLFTFGVLQLVQHSAALGRAQRLALRDHELVQIVCYQVPLLSIQNKLANGAAFASLVYQGATALAWMSAWGFLAAQVVQCRAEWAGLTTCHVAYASAVLGFEPDYLLSKVHATSLHCVLLDDVTHAVPGVSVSSFMDPTEHTASGTAGGRSPSSSIAARWLDGDWLGFVGES